ncbi:MULTISPECIES: superoxide dismutase family protein [unclassified Lysinibacillus]|uniref:superoxide dismutase family protein n=1 Tax=unclassified Lysinibacillus TaxID=2636778 RepID=UPI0037F9BCB7
MKLTTLLIISLGVFLVGCASNKEEANAPLTAKAKVIGSNNESYGDAYFEEQDNGVKVTLNLSGFPAEAKGLHGMHIHETGKCEGPDFGTAGGHFNPTFKEHGKDNPNGHHLGDLPNLEIAEDGTAKMTVMAEGVTLKKDAEYSLLDGEGTAIVIHESADDYMTDPTGESGGRIACGVIQS